jgi:hypothetical protein
MNPKRCPKHREHIEALRRMTPEERLLKAFELSESAKAQILRELRRMHPDLSDKSLMKIYVERTVKPDKMDY